MSRRARVTVDAAPRHAGVPGAVSGRHRKQGRKPARSAAAAVGKKTTLPGLILAVEWPREAFSALVGLVVGINQFTFAFGPSVVGVVRDWSGTYGLALAACMALQAFAAILVSLGPGRA